MTSLTVSPLCLLVFGLLFIVSVLLLFFSTKTVVVRFRDMGFSLFSIMRNSIHYVGQAVTGTVDAVRELAVLREEYAELTDRVARYERIERSAADVLSENRRLREQLGFFETISYTAIPAQITARDPDNLFSAIAINRGTFHGVDVNMPVIAYQNGAQGLVGKVIQTDQFESLIMPLYDSRSFVAARLADSRYEGIIEGQGDMSESLLMRFIQRHAGIEISEGDVVVSSGLGKVYLPEIGIGRVLNVNYGEYESAMEIVVEPIIDYSCLEYVFVVNKDTSAETSDVSADTDTGAEEDSDG